MCPLPGPFSLDPPHSGTPRLRNPQGGKTPLPRRVDCAPLTASRFGAPVGDRPAHHGPRFGQRLPLRVSFISFGRSGARKPSALTYRLISRRKDAAFFPVLNTAR